MTISGQSRITGGPEILQNLRSLSDAVSQKIVIQAMMKSSRLITEDAKTRIPVRTGKLKKSLRRKVRKSQGGKLISIGLGVAFYGRFLEYGTRHMAPHPFLRPAFLARKDEYTVKLLDELRARIKRVIDSQNRP